MRKFAILAVQDCIINGQFSTSSNGFQVQFDDVRAKLSSYASHILCPVKGAGNKYCYAQGFSWNHSRTKSLVQRCTEYEAGDQYIKDSLEKDWVNVFDRSVVRNRVMKGLFTQENDSFVLDDDMKKCLDTLRVQVRSDLVSRIASNMISWSAHVLANQGPVAANMGSETIAAGTVWNAIGLGKSASRSTAFAKRIVKQQNPRGLVCVYCNVAINSQLHMDHIMSFHHGGFSCHHSGNLVPSCVKCNGSNGKGSKYLGLQGWNQVKKFYVNNSKTTSELQHNMIDGSARRQIIWQDWWDEIIEFYSDHLDGTVVWNPGTSLEQLTTTDLMAIRQVLNTIKQFQP